MAASAYLRGRLSSLRIAFRRGAGPNSVLKKVWASSLCDSYTSLHKSLRSLPDRVFLALRSLTLSSDHARADQIIIGMRDDAFRWLWCALVVPVRACHVEGRRVSEDA